MRGVEHPAVVVRVGVRARLAVIEGVGLLGLPRAGLAWVPAKTKIGEVAAEQKEKPDEDEPAEPAADSDAAAAPASRGRGHAVGAAGEVTSECHKLIMPQPA